MAVTLKYGQTFFWYGTGGDTNQGGRHLFVCVAVNSGPPPEYLVIPASTFHHGRSDPTCKLDSSCCADLDHLSYAAYYKMRIVAQSVLDMADLGNRLKPAKPFTPAALISICAGIASSDEAIPLHQAFYSTHKP